MAEVVVDTADNVRFLPVWKAGATPEERFLELAQIARRHPERFARSIVVYEECKSKDEFLTRYITHGDGGVLAFLGLLEMGKAKLLRWSLDGED